FSSRRRHTRCLSDWSSDVCSSDLSRASGTPAFWLIECRSRTGLTSTLKPCSSRYFAWASQQVHCRFLYSVTLVGAAKAWVDRSAIRSAASSAVLRRNLSIVLRMSILLLRYGNTSADKDHGHHAALPVIGHRTM